MKSKQKMLSCILISCAGAAISFASFADTGDVNITPPPKPSFDTVINPGVESKSDIEHGHHHKGDIKKNKSNDTDEFQQTKKTGRGS